jgi:hypothetical protein
MSKPCALYLSHWHWCSLPSSLFPTTPQAHLVIVFSWHACLFRLPTPTLLWQYLYPEWCSLRSSVVWCHGLSLLLQSSVVCEQVFVGGISLLNSTILQGPFGGTCVHEHVLLDGTIWYDFNSLMVSESQDDVALQPKPLLLPGKSVAHVYIFLYQLHSQGVLITECSQPMQKHTVSQLGEKQKKFET